MLRGTFTSSGQHHKFTFGRVKFQIVVVTPRVQGIHILLKRHVVLFRLDCAVKQDVICIEDQRCPEELNY